MKQCNRHIRLGARCTAGIAALALSACFLVPTGTAFAEEAAEDTASSTFDDGTLTYTILDGTDVSVTSCDAAATHVSIMPKIDGYNVVSIGEEAFANCTALQALSIPETVTEIGTGAFYSCSALTSLEIPDSVTAIASGTFFNCSSLAELTLGDSITDIGKMAFGYCTSLAELTLPDSVETLGDQLFYYCTALESVEIPEKVTALGAYTFYGCLSMTEFHVPKTLEDVGAMAFFGCRSLATVTVDEGNTAYLADDNILYNQDKSVLYLYPAGRTDTSFDLPDGVLVVYAGAFFAAANLQEITLNSDLQYIGEMAFDFCSSLTSITIPKTVTTIGTTAFADCTALTSVNFEGATDEDGGEGDALEIAEYAFFCCDALKEVQLPKRVSSIGEYAFGCTSPEDSTSSETDAESDEIAVEALNDFLLIGYTGAASDYVKDSDVNLNFKAVNFDWKKLVIIAVIIAAALMIVLIAVRIIRRNMMTAEEKAALQDAKETQKTPLSARGNEEAPPVEEEPDDGYRSIVDDEDDENLMQYDEALPHGRVHQIGHADLSEEKEDKDSD